MPEDGDLAARLRKHRGQPIKLARKHGSEVCSAGGESFVTAESQIDPTVFGTNTNGSRSGFGRQRA